MNMIPKGYNFYYENGDVECVIATSLAAATAKLYSNNYASYEIKKLYHVVDVNENKIISSHYTEDRADDLMESYCEQFPNGVFDVVTEDELIYCAVKKG